jgi:hypothetical protein
LVGEIRYSCAVALWGDSGSLALAPFATRSSSGWSCA